MARTRYVTPETAIANYSAVVSGSGFVVDDPEGALGDHIGDDCDGCNVSATVHVPQVILTLSTNTMTLKHDNQCVLNVVTRPAALEFTDHKIKIAFTNDTRTYTLASGTNYTWTTKVAGNFDLHAEAKASGTVYDSSNQLAKVQFPSAAEIYSDVSVISQMEFEWQQTLNDCTLTPTNQFRERGFWVFLGTMDNEYVVSQSFLGDWCSPTNRAGIDLGGLPDDDPELSTPISDGAEYVVAGFHTHPPVEYYIPHYWVSGSRPVGPSSPEDEAAFQTYGVPGIVYDYVGFPEGSGTIPLGHLEGAPYKSYSCGPVRRVL